MTEILEGRPPSRRVPVVLGVLAALLVTVAAVRAARPAGDADDGARRAAPTLAPVVLPTGQVEEPLVPAGAYGTDTRDGTYGYAITLRSLWSEPVTVLSARALADGGGFVHTRLAVVLPGQDTGGALGRTDATSPPVPVPPGGLFTVVFRVRPSCAAPKALAEARVKVELEDERVVTQDVPLDEPEGGFWALATTGCGPVPSPPPRTVPTIAGEVFKGGDELLRYTGGTGRGVLDDGLIGYQYDVKAVWPDGFTVLAVTPVDAAGQPVPADFAVLVYDPEGAAFFDPELRAEPVTVGPGTYWQVTVRMRAECDPPARVTAFRFTVRVDGKTSDRVLTPELPPDQLPACRPRT